MVSACISHGHGVSSTGSRQKLLELKPRLNFGQCVRCDVHRAAAAVANHDVLKFLGIVSFYVLCQHRRSGYVLEGGSIRLAGCIRGGQQSLQLLVR